MKKPEAMKLFQKALSDTGLCNKSGRYYFRRNDKVFPYLIFDLRSYGGGIFRLSGLVGINIVAIDSGFTARKAAPCTLQTHVLNLQDELFDQTLFLTEETAALASAIAADVAHRLDSYLAGMPQSVAQLKTCIEEGRLCGLPLDHFTMLYSDAQYARFDALRDWARRHDINATKLDRLVDVQGPPERSPLAGVEEIHLTVTPTGESFAVTKTAVVMRSKQRADRLAKEKARNP